VIDSPPPRTRYALVLSVFVAGVALGWLLHELVMPARSTTPERLAVVAQDVPAQTRTVTPSATPAEATPSAVAATSTSVSTKTPTIQPTATATPTAQPTATPAPDIATYNAYVVASDDTLASIAADGGSDVALIRSYNRIWGQLQPGRTLIVPRLDGKTSVLPTESVLIERGRDDKPWVALTLDAGAGAEPVPDILEALRERNIRITFFLTGAWMEENPALVRQIVADGHELANHSLNHPDFRQLEDAQIIEELAETERIAQAISGTTTRPLFRPPFGSYDQRVLRILIEQGYLPIYWTLDSLDSVGQPKTPEFLFERVTGTLTGDELHGAIILAHCGSAATAAALPDILDHFAEMGLEMHTVSEVLGS
jgi:peptidoglycan/xylan/chitin deacetylase (PgdA/CDA1 family)